MKETFAALLFGVAIAGFVACGGAGRKAGAPSTMPAAQTPDGGGVLGESPKDRIRALDDQITKQLAELALTPSPVAAAVCTNPPCPQPASVKPSEDPQCKPAPSQTCKDSCLIADSICDSAKKICEIAKELGNDAWANDKCASGNASCEAAHGKCCGCS